jgi:hypothetical protein
LIETGVVAPGRDEARSETNFVAPPIRKFR